MKTASFPEQKICNNCKQVRKSRCQRFVVLLVKLLFTVLKTFYEKQRPKSIYYRNSKNFENGNFGQDLRKELLKFDITNTSLSKFNDTVLSVLDKHAPKNCNFMRKKLRKAIMNRSKLRNTLLKLGNEESKKRFNCQRNFCVSMLHKTKRHFFGELDHRINRFRQ